MNSHRRFAHHTCDGNLCDYTQTASQASVAVVGAAVVGDNSDDGSSINGGSFNDDVSDDSSCGDGDGCGGGAETVITVVVTAGVKTQQSTSDFVNIFKDRI